MLGGRASLGGVGIDRDRRTKEPLIRQLYRRIREEVLRGALRAGDRLPSSRALAEELRISRNVVLEAYDQLVAEGYLECRPGSGTFVAPGARFEADGGLPGAGPEPGDRRGEEAPFFPFSIPGTPARPEVGTPGSVVEFRTGVPDLERIPRRLLGRLFRAVCEEAPPTLFDYGRPEGSSELRSALAAYLARSRGLVCDPEDLLITTGAAQALFLAARLLIGLTGRRVFAAEDPLHLHFQRILRAAGAEVRPVPTDERGLRTDRLPRLFPRGEGPGDAGGDEEEVPADDGAAGVPGAIFVTPSHQFPLGGVLPIQRRIELVRFARLRGAFLIEDDYESEYRFSGTAVSPLRELDPGRVCYVGTFSKILAPAMRVGYLVLPPFLREAARGLKYDLDNHTSGPDQIVLARLLESGRLERHVAALRKIYARRRARLIGALERTFPGRHRVLGASAGLHLVVVFPGTRFDGERLAACLRAGVRVHPLEAHALRKGLREDHLILGYGNLTEEAIDEGVRRLGVALADRALPSRPSGGKGLPLLRR